MNRMWSVRTKPYRVCTVEPSTIGSRSRCTPSRDTSGPTVPRSPAILSISSMKITPWFSTRSSDSFTTSSMSTSFFSSSSIRMRRASCRCTVRRFFFFGSISCSSSVKLTSVPSMPCGGCIISSPGKPCCCTSISTSRSSSFPSLSCWRSFSRVRRRRSWASTSPSAALGVTSPLDETTNKGGFSPGSRPGGGRREGRCRRGGKQQIQQALFRARFGLGIDVVLALGAHHVDRHVHELAHHGLDVAAHVADLGELGRLDLQERRAREARQPARDLGLPHPGGADHDDVVREDLVADVLRRLRATPAVAHRDRDGLLRHLLAHDVAVQLRHDLPGRQLLEPR